MVVVLVLEVLALAPVPLAWVAAAMVVGSAAAFWLVVLLLELQSSGRLFSRSSLAAVVALGLLAALLLAGVLVAAFR
jgi:hypothetical protein